MHDVMRIIIDLEVTLTISDPDSGCEKHMPRIEVVAKLAEYPKLGYEIVIHTAQNMKKFPGNLGKININTQPVKLNWLETHKIRYDEVIVAKPWCVEAVFYVDNRAIRPSQFNQLSPAQINYLLQNTR